MTKSEFRKAVKSCNNGEVIYINAIGLSIAGIEQLREYIKTGVLHPDRKEVEKAIVPLKIESVMCGDIIVPQMTYTVKKGGE